MPKVMEKRDWARTVANVGSADHVWYENVMGRNSTLSVSIPERGMYQVILVKIDSPGSGEAQAEPKKPTLFETLRSCPCGGIDLKVERENTTGRPAAFA